MFAPQPVAPNGETDDDIGQETQRRQQMLRFGLLMFLLFFMLDNKKQVNNSGSTNRTKTEIDLPTEIPLSSQYTQQIQKILTDHQDNSGIYHSLNATGLYRGTWQSLRTVEDNTSVRITGSSLLQLVSLPVRDVPDLSFVYGLLHLYKNAHRGSEGSVQVSLEAGFPLQGVLISSQQKLVLFSTPYKSQRLYLRIASKQHFHYHNTSINNIENKSKDQVSSADTQTTTVMKRRLVGTQRTDASYGLREIEEAPTAVRDSGDLGLSEKNLLPSTVGLGMPKLQRIVQLMLEPTALTAVRESYPQHEGGFIELDVLGSARNLLAVKEEISAAVVNGSSLTRSLGISSIATASSREEVLTGLTEHGFLSVILADKPLQQYPPPSHTPNKSTSSTAAHDKSTSKEANETTAKDFMVSIAIGEPLLPTRFKTLQSSATPPSLIAALAENSSTGGNNKIPYSATSKSGYVPVDCQYTARLAATSVSSHLAVIDHSEVKLPTATESKSLAANEADSIAQLHYPETKNFPLESVLSIGGSMQSLNCGKEFNIQATSFSLELDKLRSKVDIYALLATLLCLIQIFLVIYQMKRSDTQALVSRISIVSVFAQSLLDANLCMTHLLLSFAFPTLFFASFIWIAVLKLLLFSVFQMRLLINIYQARYSQELSSEGWQGLRARLISLHVRFYGAVLFVLVISVSFYNRPVVGVFALYSFWVPQIVHCAYYGTKHSLHPLYLIGTTLSRCFIPLYVLGCPDNFLAMLSIYINPQYLALVSDATADSASGSNSQHTSSVRDLSMSSFSACWVLVLWLALQLGLLLLQSALGPRFFVPKQWLPQRYEYQRPIPQSVLESLAAGTPTATGSTRSSITGGVVEGDSRDTTGDIALTGIRSRSSVTSRNGTLSTPISSSLQTFLFGTARGGVSQSNSADYVIDGADLETGSLLGDFQDRDQDSSGIVLIPNASSVAEQNRRRAISEGGGLECVICYNPIHLANRDYMITPCDHVFHEECLVQWADVKLECPVCRSALPAMGDDPS